MASTDNEAQGKTTGRKSVGGSLRVRDHLIVAFSFLLATVMMAPALAGAMTLDGATAKSNATSTGDVLGGIPTRITWEGTVEEGEEVSSLVITFPEGSDCEGSTAKLTILEGLDRLDVEGTTVFDGLSLSIDFAEPIPANSLLRVEMYDVSLPAQGGEIVLAGTYTTSDGVEHAFPESPKISVIEITATEQIIRWLDDQEWVDSWNSVPFLRMFFNPQLVVAAVPSLFVGWLRAFGLVLIGFPLAIPIGLCVSFIKMSKVKIFKMLASLYVNVIRGTPLFLQIYIAFFGLPLLGINVNNYVLGVLVLAMNSSAYLAEIFRAGIQSIHKGQFEAARSLGMNGFQTMFSVIIPQTVRRVIPTMTSEFILLYKDTSLLSAVGVMELMMFSKSLTANSGNVTPYIVAAGYYLLVTMPLIKVVSAFEAKLAQSEGSGPAGKDDDDGKRRKKRGWKSDSEDTLAVSSAIHESR